MKAFILLFLIFSFSSLQSQIDSKKIQRFLAKNHIIKSHKKPYRFNRTNRNFSKKNANAKELMSIINMYEKLRSFDGKKLPRELRQMKKKLKQLRFINSINRQRYTKIRRIGKSVVSYSKYRVSRIGKQKLAYSYFNTISHIGDVRIKYQFGKVQRINKLKIKRRYGKIYKIGEYRLR